MLLTSNRNPIEQILNLCCSLYLLEEAANNINSNSCSNNNHSSSFLNPYPNSVNSATRNTSANYHNNGQQCSRPIADPFNVTDADTACIPKVCSCCLLQLFETNFDIFTNQPHLIYLPKPKPNQSAQNSDLDQSQSQSLNLISAKPSAQFNFSEIPFINIIWNTREPWEIGLKTGATIPFVLLAIVGNVGVIRIIFRARLTKSSVNLFILNMSVADLLTACIFPWIFLVSDFYQRFVLGKIICEFEGSVLSTLMLTSVLSLTVISYDRLTAVVFPFKKRMEAQVARCVIYSIWIISAAVSSPLVIWRTYMERQWLDFHEVWCNEDRSASQLYWLLLISLLVWFPLGALVISYSAIIIKLDSLEKRHGHGQSDAANPIQLKMKSKVIRMFFMVVVLFIFCWVPFTAFTFYRNKLTANKSSAQVPVWLKNLLFVSHYLMFVNSAVNPIIYGLMNDNLKRGFRQAVPACFRKRDKLEVSTVLGKHNVPNKKALKTHLTGTRTRTTNKHGTGTNLALGLGLQAQPNTTGYGHDNQDSAILNRKRKYYENILFSNPSLEKASLSSFERRDSALADLGLPVPQSIDNLRSTTTTSAAALD